MSELLLDIFGAQKNCPIFHSYGNDLADLFLESLSKFFKRSTTQKHS